MFAAKTPDPAGLILQDHAVITQLFGLVQSAIPSKQILYFRSLARLLKVHEKMEQTFVYPVLIQFATSALRTIIHAREHEEAKAATLLESLESMAFGTTAWFKKFSALQVGVMSHAEHEETTIIPALIQRVPQKEYMALRYAMVQFRAAHAREFLLT